MKTNEKLQVAEAGSRKDGKRTSQEFFIRRPDDDVSLAADIIDPDTSEPSEMLAQRLVDCWNGCMAIKKPEAINSLVGIAEDIAVALRYPRGSEAQVRCLEEIGQDAAYILKSARE